MHSVRNVLSPERVIPPHSLHTIQSVAVKDLNVHTNRKPPALYVRSDIVVFESVDAHIYDLWVDQRTIGCNTNYDIAVHPLGRLDESVKYVVGISPVPEVKGSTATGDI